MAILAASTSGTSSTRNSFDFVQAQPLAQLLGGIQTLVQRVLGVARVDLHQHISLLHEAATIDVGFGNIARRVAANLRFIVGGKAAGKPQSQVPHDRLDGLFAEIPRDGLARRRRVRPDALEIRRLGGRGRLGPRRVCQKITADAATTAHEPPNSSRRLLGKRGVFMIALLFPSDIRQCENGSFARLGFNELGWL